MASSNMAFNGGIQLRESGGLGNNISAIEYGPRISFHWGNIVAKSITLHSDGIFYFRDQNGTTRSTIDANINGNASSASSASSVAWGNVTGKPSTYTPSSHTHSYLPLSGGTLTGALTVPSDLTILPENNGIEGGQMILSASNSGYPAYLDVFDKYFRIHSGNCRFSVDLSNGALADCTLPWNNISGKPSTYAPSSHTHNYAATSHEHSRISISTDGAWWWSANNGNDNFRVQKSEGNDSTTPTQYDFVFAATSNGGTRGAALSIDWRGGSRNVFARQLHNDSTANGWTTGWYRIWAEGNSVTGAVWNDYAEYRETDTTEPGRCVFENGDDTMSLSTKRLQKGCAITSDTWGFAQGKTENAHTPIAVAGRVLAYPYESREKFRNHIGDAVCSGPNGTISIMTDEEVRDYPLCILGTISAVPDYEKWGGGDGADRDPVDINGRIWIKVR